MGAYQRYIQYRKDELYHFNPNHDPKDGKFTFAKGVRKIKDAANKVVRWIDAQDDLDAIMAKKEAAKRGEKNSSESVRPSTPAPDYEQNNRDVEMRDAANNRDFQLMYQKDASDTSLDYWDRSDAQDLADYHKQQADSAERLARSNDEVYVFKPSTDEKRLEKTNAELSKLTRFDEPAPDVSKTKPGTDERLRALDFPTLMKDVKSSSGDWYNSEPKSARWKKIYKDEKNGKKITEYDLAKAALLDMGYKATPENIDYLVRRHVIFWD